VSQPDHPHVVCCADEAYARPLAAMVRSLLDRREGRPLTVYVVDAGLRAKTRARLERSWPELHVTWIAPRLARLAKAPVSGHASPANYVRLLMEDLLPPEVTRVLYLDVDLVALDDIEALWQLPLGDAAVLAAQDVAAPWIDGDLAPNADLARPHAGTMDPIRNYRALGLDGRAKYFNTGVMLIALDLWRREGLGARFLDCLVRHREHVRFWDQYPLNVVLAGRWGELHPRWNAQIQVHAYPTWRESPYDEATWTEVTRHPCILHYAAPVKPWDHAWARPGGEAFFRHLDRTDWAGWRPRRPLLGWTRFRWARSLRKRTRRLAARLRRRG